jgi:hypothetical protein
MHNETRALHALASSNETSTGLGLNTHTKTYTRERCLPNVSARISPMNDFKYDPRPGIEDNGTFTAVKSKLRIGRLSR